MRNIKDLRPTENNIRILLLSSGYDEVAVQNFLEKFFLYKVLVDKYGMFIQIWYLKGTQFDWDFAFNLENFFRSKFSHKLIIDFDYNSVEENEIILRKKQRRKKRESWSSHWLKNYPVTQIDQPNAPLEMLAKTAMPHHLLSAPIISSIDYESYSQNTAPVSSDSKVTLTYEDKNIVTPIEPVKNTSTPTKPSTTTNTSATTNTSTPTKPSATTKPSEPKKSFNGNSNGKKIMVEKISGNITTIYEVRLTEKATSRQVIISGAIGTDERNGVKLREFKGGYCAVSFALIDDTDGITCKRFFKSKSGAENFVSQLKDVKRLVVEGIAQFDEYLGGIIVSIDAVAKAEERAPRQDNAEVKRVELHVHTTLSALDAIISPETLVNTAAAWNWSAVAITDHGVVQAFPFAADAAEKLAKKGKHIKVIYGMEGYLSTEGSIKTSYYHVIILAKNKIGLDNLYRLVSISQLKYFYQRPRIPKEILSKFREGLIIGSACAQGELISAIVDGKSDAEIEDIANFYDYLEIQPIHNNDYLKKSERFPQINTDDDLIDINKRVAAIAEKLGKPLVATCDAHFLNSEDSLYRAIMMSGKGFKSSDEQPPIFLRITDEMLEEFTYLDKETAYKAVVENPNMIADSIEELKPIPDGLYSPQMPGADDEIETMSYKKAYEMYGKPLPKIVLDRLEQELTPIMKHGFSVLYLIAQKLVKKSNDDGYLVGSRGSVGSSFVAAMTGITEVNPLPPHYRCPKCQYSEFFTKGEAGCGYDLPDKNCPVCGHPLTKDGHDIPFAVFLGFDGDKVPDIDLNFSGEYQSAAHKYTEILFGRHNVYRAGTISTIADKTAYGFAKKYYEELDSNEQRKIERAGSFISYQATKFTGVKRTTGQHPAGIMVVPRDMDIHYFTPIQHPAEDKSSGTITTHFDYHSISSRLVKLDILGHDDPTVIKMLENITHINPLAIPLDDKPTLSLFSSTKAIGLKPAQLGTNSGTFGIPEFRTSFTRQMIDDTKPKCFSDLVRISGFSHGTDVWLGNAQDLINNKICELKDAISARDDIMMYLIHNGVEALTAFKIMESVRKGKGIKPEQVEMLKEKGIPDWYIDACQKIKYLFPRAHATAYVMMAYRIAYCKVHYPMAYYAAYFSIRADEFDADEIVKGKDSVKTQIERLENLSHERKLDVKETEKLAVLQVAHEMFLRGIGVKHVDLYKSDAEKFIVLEDEQKLLPPLSSLTGLGTTAAKGIVDARKNGEFSSIEDLTRRAKINKTAVEVLRNHGSLDGMAETNQIMLFDF